MSYDRIASILSTLVAFDTTSRNSNLAIIDWIERFLAPHGFSFERIYDETGLKANLWASIGPQDEPGFVLSGHTDVVPVDGQNWSSDPFTVTERDGRLYGRGTCDMKGFLAVCLANAERMAQAPLARPIHFAFSYDEEVGCVGARGLVSWLRDQPVRPQACFVGEPSGMQVVLGHKAKRSLVATIRGLTRHSSLAPQGVKRGGVRCAAGGRDPPDRGGAAGIGGARCTLRCCAYNGACGHHAGRHGAQYRA